jgi:small subunit ribosomal protein S16
MDSGSPREGKYVDILGTYDPKRKELLSIKPEKVKEWIEKGAELTDRVKSILKNAKIL